MKPFKFIAAPLLVILFFSACRKIEAPSYLIAAEAKTMLDVAYGDDPKQKLDVYLPANRTTNTTVIIFVHGGSFIGGDKSEFSKQAAFLAAKGYAVLNVNYRLIDKDGLFNIPPVHKESAIKIKDQVNDIQHIVDFAINNSRTWVMSKAKIAVAGHSAGATLALLYAYGNQNTGKVQAVANIAGALNMVFTDIPGYEFLPDYVYEGAYRYTGKIIATENIADFKAISPLYLANENRQIPTLTIFPENNNVMGLPAMDYSTCQNFITRLNELKVPNQFIFMPGANHYFDRNGDWVTVLDQTGDYFDRMLK